MDNIERITKSEANRMRKFYAIQEKKIKTKLLQAIEKGNDTTYLSKLSKSIKQDIATLQVYYMDYSTRRMPKIYNNQSGVVDEAIAQFDTTFDVDSSFMRPNDRAIRILSENTAKNYTKVTIAMGRQSQDFLRKVGLKATSGIVFGSDTWQQAARDMRKELERKEFFHVKYKLKDGGVRKVPAKVYSQMVARTTSAEAFRSGTIERIKAWGYDLVDVQGISRFPGSPCIPYQGKTLSISGNTEGYTPLEDARMNGFNHPNCIHSLVFSEKNKELI